jgi:transketolase
MTYENLLKTTAEQNPGLMVLTAENRAVIRGLPAVLGDRFIDFGIAEQTMVGAAAGLALRGRTPVAHALATFLIFRAYEFVRDDVCIPGLPVKLVGGVPGFLSDGNGPTHQAIEDVAIMRGLPNMQVFTPADEIELLNGMPKILASGKPCYIRYCGLPATIEHARFEIGKAEVIGNGSDVALLTYGFMLRETVEAKKILEAKGVSVRLVNLRMPKPVDEQAIVEAVKETKGLVVTIEDHFLTGGLYSILGETCLKHGVAPKKVLPIALEERWFKPALLKDVLEHEGFTGEQIAQKILREVR